MSTFRVGTTPQQVYQGNQPGSVTIVNLGPSTLYLNADSSVGPYNGLYFPAMGQMEWDMNAPLWAVCRAPVTPNDAPYAVLSTDPSGGPVDANRSRFWTLLGTKNNFANSDVMFVDTGHCETVLLKVTTTSPQDAAPTIPTVFRFKLIWMDELGNNIEYDTLEVANLGAVLNAQSPGFIFIRIPVIGNVLNVQWLQNGGSNNYGSLDKVEVYGTDRALPYRWYCSNPFTLAPILGYNNIDSLTSFGGDGFSIFQGVNFGSRTYFANLGKMFHLEFRIRNCTAAGFVNVLLFDDGANIAHTPAFAVSGAAQLATVEVIDPQKQLCYIQPNGASLAGNNYDVQVTWKDL